MKIETDSPQVKFPPPAAVLLAVVSAFILRALVPAPFLSEGLRWCMGILFWSLGILLMFSSAMQFRRNKTNIAPWQSTSAIIQDGPYRFSRNPIYLSFLVMMMGSVCLANNLWSFASLLLLYLFLRFYVIEREEKYLRQKFSDTYGSFLARTRRWL